MAEPTPDPPAPDPTAAEAHWRDRLRDDPHSALARHNLGVALADQGKLDDAVASFAEALRLSPEYVEAHLNLANALATVGRPADAIGHYRQALTLRPTSPDALNGLGLALLETRRAAEAVIYLQQATRLRPDFAEAHNSLGMALNELTRWPEAEAAIDQALRLRPQYVEAHTNLGSCYAHQGRLSEALAQYDLARWLSPGQIATHWNRSLSLLQLGDYERGWAEYEWRWQRRKSPLRSYSQPLWDGAPLDGRTILVWPEQGLGDTVQFSRYLPMIRDKGGRVAFECPLPLLTLLAEFPGVDQLVPEGQPLPAFDVHVPLMSLPRLFGTTLQTVPAAVPRAPPSPERVAFHRARRREGLNVGIAWQGNPHHQWDRHRSIPLRTLAPLAAIAGVTLHGLQRGPGVEQTAGAGVPLVESLDPALTDAAAWAEVAAIMASLDLVITVDTATAHVAGAAGVPTWVLLSAMCDWRWLQHRDDTPWYPSVRLFRQTRLGDWPSVVGSVCDAIRVKI